MIGSSSISRRAAPLFVAVLVLLAAGAAPAAGPPGADELNLTVIDPPRPTPDAAVETMDGAPIALADLRGRVAVVNFWATWCAPCVEEMPSLDRLSASLDPAQAVVVAISGDRGGAKVVRPFLERRGIGRLDVWIDAKGRLARAAGIRGLPTTFVVDREGRIVGMLEGAAAWDSAAAKALIQHYVGKGRSRDLPGVERASLE